MKSTNTIDNQTTVNTQGRFGFTEYAELLNGRLAMIGFVAAILMEVFSDNTLVGLFIR